MSPALLVFGDNTLAEEALMKAAKSDWQNLDSFIQTFAQISQNFVQELDDKQVADLGTELKNKALTQQGLGFQNALESLCDDVIPYLSASRGPRYWGFVTGGATPVATFADWLVSTFDQNVAKDGDSIATNVERQTIRWLCELFDLPDSFDGTITTGATSANFLGALCARQFVGSQQNMDVAKQGMAQLQVEVFSTTPHASMLKGLGMAGFGHQNVTYVKALDESEAIDVEDLSRQLAASDKAGKIIIASAGTVTATDFDDLVAIAHLAKKHNAWLHVDAAFGIFERLLSQDNPRSNGLELADSITLDSHKWLNVPYESGVFITRHLKLLFSSCDVPAPYLVSHSNKPDFMSLGIENSRRFRALPVWLTLLAYGRDGITEWVKKNISCAQAFANRVDAMPEYELVLDCKLNVVLFRPNCQGLDDEAATHKTNQILTLINQDGRLFLSPGQWRNQSIIRAAFSNWETEMNDVEIALECLADVAKKYQNSHY